MTEDMPAHLGRSCLQEVDQGILGLDRVLPGRLINPRRRRLGRLGESHCTSGQASRQSQRSQKRTSAAAGLEVQASGLEQSSTRLRAEATSPSQVRQNIDGRNGPTLNT